MIKMNKNKILLIIFCISLPLFLLLFSYKINLYFTDLTSDQQNAINFLDNKENLIGNYTSNEKSHMQDVKRLIKKVNYLFYFLLLIITSILTYYKKDKNHILKLLKKGGLTSIVSLLILLSFIILSFNQSFIFFHEIFFPQGNWQFPYDSFLIQTFPLNFFIVISQKIFITALISGIIIFLTEKLFKLKFN